MFRQVKSTKKTLVLSGTIIDAMASQGIAVELNEQDIPGACLNEPFDRHLFPTLTSGPFLGSPS